MIKDTLKVGSTFGTEKYSVEVQLQYPENDADIAKLIPTEELRAKIMCRGWAIWNQEQSGARDIVASATVAERTERAALTAKVQKCIDEADITAPAKRSGRTQAPVVIDASAAQKAMESGDLVALQAMLLAAGVKNVSFSK